MFCSKCGNKLEEGVRFCVVCWAKADLPPEPLARVQPEPSEPFSGSAQAAYAAQTPLRRESGPAAAPKKKLPAKLFLITAWAIVLGVGAAGVIYFQQQPRFEKALNAYLTGRSFYDTKDYDNAITQFNEAISLNQDYAEAYAWRGSAYYYKKQYDDAIKDYTEAISFDPNYALAYAHRGDAYVFKGQLDDAIRDLTEAVRIDPNYAWAYASRGNAYGYKGQFDDAIRDFNEAIRLNPDYVYAYAQRGLVYKIRGQRDSAIHDYETALRLDPNNTVASDGLRELRGY